MLTDQSEIALQKRICLLLAEGRTQEIPIVRSTHPNVRFLRDLLIGQPFDILTEDSREKWNLHPETGIDIVGGSRTAPDIILTSKQKSDQRIIIEVKKHARFVHQEPAASQIARYFLYLLYTSRRYPEGKEKRSIQRGVFLAATAKWFSSSKAKIWESTVQIYRP